MKTKVCSKCWIEKELTEFTKNKGRKDWVRSICKECWKEAKRISDKKYYEKNKEKSLATSRKWKENNKEKLKEYKKKYREANIEHIRERDRKYREENRELLNERRRDYYRDNPDKRLEKNKKHSEYKKWEWLENARTASQKRRALKVTTDDWTITTESKKELMSLQCNTCNECWCCLIENNYHLDHIIPISKWWIHSIHNVQYLCAWCNLSKWAKMPNEE